MKKLPVFSVVMLSLLVLLASCAPSEEALQSHLADTVEAFTPVPTQTAYPTQTAMATYTPYPTATMAPTVAITEIVEVEVAVTPTPDLLNIDCWPIEDMDYTNNTVAFKKLQEHVGSLPGVRQYSYTVNEKLYSNSLSHIVHVLFVADDDGQVYSKRYIVYLDELGWSEGVFSIDGQCWVDGPHR